MMETVFEFVSQNISLAPYIICGLLLLAGFNIPISEDGMLFISAYLASRHPEYTYQLFAGVYAGAYLSDLICYGLGRYFGKHIWRIKFLAKMVTQERVERISSFYDKYGFWTLLFGRFIPFGVRNGLFLTAGIGKMNPFKFAFSDWIAATISCSVFFTIYFQSWESVVSTIQRANLMIFIIAAALVLGFMLRKAF